MVKFDKKAASPPHTENSIVFARWRQCAPHLIYASLGPPKSVPQTASWSVQLFWTAHGIRSLSFTMGLPFARQNYPCAYGI